MIVLLWTVCLVYLLNKKVKLLESIVLYFSRY